MSRIKETALYQPVKSYFEGQGYAVKGEVGAVDVLATRGDDVLIVELKVGFSLQLLQQAVARQAVTDDVFVAVPRWKGKSGWKTFKGNVGLCRRLGIGVLSVNMIDHSVQCHCEPGPYKPRKSKRKKNLLMKEFAARRGDPNLGGMARSTVVTAYRQAAIACAEYLRENGASKGAHVARATGATFATTLMRHNHYGWFKKSDRGIYVLNETGLKALESLNHQSDPS